MKKRILILVVMIAVLNCSFGQSVENPTMVYVQGGTYNLNKLLGIGSESVNVRDLYVQKYETTKKEWEEYLKATNKEDFYKVGIQQNHYEQVVHYSNSPIVGVTFFEALEYCNWKSENEGFEPVYELKGTMSRYFKSDAQMPDIVLHENANGYRLPTEKEWIYFALGGEVAIEDEWWKTEDINDYGWIYLMQLYTEEVGQLKANPLGLYDVIGNVWEWCWDIKPGFEEKGVNPYRLIEGASLRYRPDSDIFSWKDFLSLTSRLSQHGGSNPLSRFYIGIRMVRNAKKN